MRGKCFKVFLAVARSKEDPVILRQYIGPYKGLLRRQDDMDGMIL